MVRLILAIIFVLLFLVLSIPLMIFAWIFGKFNRPAADKFSLAVVNWAFRVVLFIGGCKRIIIGRERIPVDRAVVYIPNHRSFFDAVLTYPNVVGPTGFIAKNSLEKVPLLNVWMRLLHCMFLDRSDAKKGLQLILNAIEQAKTGISFCIFPEGTRNRNYDTDDLLPFHNGSLKIAVKSGAPVIPVTIIGSQCMFETHAPFFRKTTVVIEYGEPIYIENLEKDAQKNIGNLVSEIIKETYIRNKETYAAQLAKNK